MTIQNDLLTSDKQQWLDVIVPIIQEVYGARLVEGKDVVLPSVALTQAIQESGFGRPLRKNLFGMEVYDQTISSLKKEVEAYYDFLASNPIYQDALNLDDAEESLRKIAEAGYSIDPNYADNCVSILKNYNFTQVDDLKSAEELIDFLYHSEGYDRGIEDYSRCVELLDGILKKIQSAEKTIQMACQEKPRINVEEFMSLGSLESYIDSGFDLLKNIRYIADNEKYLAEAIDEKDGLTKLQASVLAMGSRNFSFTNPDDFHDMVSDFQENGEDKEFLPYLQGYASVNGIESKLINIPQFVEAIKKADLETGAVLSKDYVVSKATYLFHQEDELPVENYQAGSVTIDGESGVIHSVSATKKDNPIIDVDISKEQEDSVPLVDVEMHESSPEQTIISQKEGVETLSTEPIVVEGSSNPVYTQATVSSAEVVPVPSTIPAPTPVENNVEVTSPPVNSGDDVLVSVNPSSNPPVPISMPERPVFDNKKSSESSAVVPIALGAGTALAATGGTYLYTQKKRHEDEEDELDDFEI